MKKLCELSVQDIALMDYNNVISVVRETNRAPGGYATLQEVANVTCLSSKKRLLEIGTSTGITAIELARLTGCDIFSIDINERSIIEAEYRAKEEGVSDRIHFSVQDARQTSFESESFDVVFCGNVTSLIPQKEAAREEYYRVLKQGGFLVAVPMYYIKNPTTELIKNVSSAIKTDVEVLDKSYWIDFYKHDFLCLKYIADFKFNYIEDATLDSFIEYILSKPHLSELQNDVYEALSRKYREYIYLFRDNLSHMGYSIIVMSKEKFNDEPELFTGTRVYNI